MLTSLLFLALSDLPKDVKVVDLKDGYVRASTPKYSVEIPKGWAVTAETPWGDRKMRGEDGQLGVMTAGPTTDTWDELYRTSLFFINREERGTATPYTLGKTGQGYESMSFSVKNTEGFASRRYVLVKNDKGLALALSVRILKQDDEKTMQKHFDRMVQSARIK